MRHGKFSALVLLAFSSLPARAAVVTLDAAYRAALLKNESIAIEGTKVAASEARVDAGFGRVLPRLSAVGAYTRQARPTGLQNAATNPEQSSARFSLSQPLFQGLSDIYGWQALKERKEAAELRETSVRQNLYGSVAAVYYGLVSAREDLSDVKLLARHAQDRREEIRRRVGIGRSRPADLLSAESQLARFEAAVLAAEASVRVAQEDFALATQLDPAAELENNWKPLPPLTLETTDLQKSVESRPDLAAAKREVEAADSTVAAAQGAHLPTIELGANYFLHRTGFLRDVKWDVGVTATLPLYQGGTLQAQVREASEVRKSAELELALRRREAVREVQTLYAQYEGASRQWGALSVAQDLSQKNYQQQEKDFKLGLVGNLEVLQALEDWQEAGRAADKTYFQAKIWHAQLLAALGRVPTTTEAP